MTRKINIDHIRFIPHSGRACCYHCGDFYQVTPSSLKMACVILKQYEREHRRCKLTERGSDLEAANKQLESTAKQLVDTSTELATTKQATEFLKSQVKFDPRIIKPAVFKERLKKVVDANDFIRLYAAPLDHTLENIAQTIAGWPDDVPMRLDHDNMRVPLSYLQHIDILNEDEMKFLLQDCTRDEAFIKESE